MNQKANANDDTIQIDLLRLARACLKSWWMILLVTIAFGAVTYVGTKELVTPLYQSSVKIYVNNSEINVGSVSVSTSDLSASIQLVDLYEVILNTKDTLDEVIKQTGLDYDYTDIQAMLTTSSVNDTQVFEVVVTNPSPEEAQLIASTIGTVLPEVIQGIIDSADARIVESAIVPTQKSSPSYTSNTIKGALVGFVLAVLVICLLDLLDITIREESDFKSIVDAPVLAYIPDYNSKYENKYGRYGKYGKYGKYEAS